MPIAEPIYMPRFDPTPQLAMPTSTIAISRRRMLSRLGSMMSLTLAPKVFGAVQTPWMPYDQFKVIQPMLTLSPETGQVVNGRGYKRIDAPDNSPDVPATALGRDGSGSGVSKLAGNAVRPPSAYVQAAQAQGFDPRILYAVALQESKLMFGQRALPYPWTLCVRGVAERHDSYEQSLEALRKHIRQGVTNVDCGVMQVNWRWHQDKLGTPERALDPHPNLAVGAQILADHFRVTRNWRTAIACYHAGSITSDNQDRASRYAQHVITRMARMGLVEGTRRV
jgi:hypothetical protein